MCIRREKEKGRGREEGRERKEEEKKENAETFKLRKRTQNDINEILRFLQFNHSSLNLIR